MKRYTAILTCLLLTGSIALAQNTENNANYPSRHYLGGGVRLGATSLNQKGAGLSSAGLGFGIDAEYTYFFHHLFGIQTGLSAFWGNSNYILGSDYTHTSQTTIQSVGSGGILTDYTIDYTYVTNGLKEEYRYGLVSLPVMLRMQSDRFFIGAGFRFAFPMGDIKADYASGNTDVTAQLTPTDNAILSSGCLGIDSHKSQNGSYTYKGKNQVNVAAEIGYHFPVNDAYGIRVSAYGEYMLNNGSQNGNTLVKEIDESQINGTPVVLGYNNCSKNNLVDKSHYYSVGVKVAFDWGSAKKVFPKSRERAETVLVENDETTSDSNVETKKVEVPTHEDLMIFIRNTNGKSQYYGSYCSENRWSSAVSMLSMGDPSKRTSVNYALSPDGKITILALDGEGGMGGKDLFVSYLDGYQWSEPQNMGIQVNSRADEDQPAFAFDGKTLYFVSNRERGLGQNDIWFTRLLPDRTWTAAENAGTAINSNGDEQTPVFYNNRLYFASNGRNGSGGYDIYYVTIGTDNEPTSLAINIGQNINTGADEIGIHSIRSLSGNNGFKGTKAPSQLMPYLEGRSITNVLLDSTFNIHFKTGSATVTDASLESIMKVARYLSKNPTTIVEVSGHTDNTGGDDRNVLLSWERAKAVHRKLIDYGVNPSQVTYHGYGNTQPIAPNATEWGRARNRRTEFKVLKK
ncbi:MAG: OmpA family protein [Bacteroidales bacterium]|nr:OmpA family protein [Bacteroidales bacterium]